MKDVRRSWLNGGRGNELATTAPSFGWLMVLFAIPTLLVVALSFRQSDAYGGVSSEWTLQAWRELSQPSYPKVLWRTLWLSAVTTVVCIAAALPVAFLMGNLPPRRRALLLLFMVVPFWTNFLIRVFAWKVILHPGGYLRRALLSSGWIEEQTLLLYNEGAVLLVMVYTYLPFAILPLYAAAERFDYRLLDAARDLGASNFQAFIRVFVPGIGRGVIAAVAMVLIPSLGSYVIPDMVGGPSGEMLGNKIADRIFVDRNLPHAAAIATVLIAVTFIPVLLAFAYGRTQVWQARRKREEAK